MQLLLAVLKNIHKIDIGNTYAKGRKIVIVSYAWIHVLYLMLALGFLAKIHTHTPV